MEKTTSGDQTPRVAGRRGLLGAVLCGGKSSRMGADKAALTSRIEPGRTFFDVATDRLKQLCTTIAVSGRCSIDHQFVTIDDNVSNHGPMGGVLSSLGYAARHGFDACLVTPIDVPYLTDRDLVRLVEAWNASSMLTVAFSDRIEPLIAIYPVFCEKSLQQSIRERQRSLAKFAIRQNANQVALPTSSCRNMNRPSDLVSSGFAFQHPDDALRAAAARLSPRGTELAVEMLAGRVLAESIYADRDSPAADVSAMDGYAVRQADLNQDDPCSVTGELACGRPTLPMPSDGVLKIFTGAVVPPGCDRVVKREDVLEGPQSVQWTDTAKNVEIGANIRRRGENLAAGGLVLERGVVLSGPNLAALANFGCFHTKVFARVRVSLLTTGDEIVDDQQTPQTWQLRNSNSHALSAMFACQRWIDLQSAEHCGDRPDQLADQLDGLLRCNDVVVLTGGVSMGDHDYVPGVVKKLGGEIIFHKLPIRPGKPLLVAVTPNQKCIVGLPGNPVSAVVNAKRMVMPLLAKLSGQTQWLPRAVKVKVSGLSNRRLPLHQMVLVRTTRGDHVKVVPSKGSGDLVALAQSDGFVEIPASASPAGDLGSNASQQDDQQLPSLRFHPW